METLIGRMTKEEGVYAIGIVVDSKGNIIHTCRSTNSRWLRYDLGEAHPHRALPAVIAKYNNLYGASGWRLKFEGNLAHIEPYHFKDKQPPQTLKVHYADDNRCLQCEIGMHVECTHQTDANIPCTCRLCNYPKRTAEIGVRRNYGN